MVWGHVKPLAGKAFNTSRGRMGVDDLYMSAKAGAHVLWIVHDPELGVPIATFTTRIVQYPTLRAMALEWIGGTRMREWFADAHAHVVTHAVANGCSRVEAAGRRAWSRWIMPHGWEAEHVQYILEV